MEIENLLKLIDTVSRSELTGFRYEENGVKLNLSKKKEKIQTVQSVFEPIMAEKKVAVSESDKVEETTDIEGEIISSPLVGTYYEAPAEGADPFVKVGDIVKKGQILAIVEAMKLMNDIESDFDGEVAEILVENGQPVEYGQPLFVIR